MLESEIGRLKDADCDRLRSEYETLVAGLRRAQEQRENEAILSNPVLPEHVLQASRSVVV